MNSDAKSNLIFILATSFIAILLMVILTAVSWSPSGTTSYFSEDTSFTYNFTANVSNPDNDTLVFKLDTIVSNPNYVESTNPVNYPWITINSSSGIMIFNSTHNNETGRFNITVEIRNLQNTSFQGSLFYFIANATNDAPNFTNIKSEYNLTQDTNFLDYLNATDEEEHYPLYFNITFFGNCTHAAWTGRAEGENCTILSSTNFSNTSAMMNFTPVLNDVGTYWANITVMDFGNSSDYGCPHAYCTESTYSLNMTTLYSSIVKFNIKTILSINISDCQNKIFQENESGACQINISTANPINTLNTSSIAQLRGYTGSVLNESWFFSKNLSSSTNFSRSININFTPQKTEVGNWTINFTVQDLSTGENVTQQIYVYVNKSVSLDDAPDLENISDVTTSVNLLTTINLNVFDEDLRIPHKDINFGGYNETISFNVTILNSSDLSQELNISGFDIEILSMPVLSSGVPTNKTTAQIQFNPNLNESGDYTINITVTDLNNVTDTETFNMTIISNLFPFWNSTLQTNYSVVEGGSFYLNLSNYSIDLNGDTLNFTNFTTTTFPAFFLNKTSGEINISGIDDIDVGQHIINITISDGFLTNTTVFIFTINNTNEAPFIKTPLTAISNITINITNSNMNATEDSGVEFQIFINDTDFNIIQKEFYSENLTINLTIEGANTNLFNLTFQSFIVLSSTNYSKYSAIFIPRKGDIGNYTISINVSDKGNLSDFISFNLTIAEIQHNPSMVDKNDSISSIEESLLIDFNATDLEDGNDSDGSLRFNVTFVLGADFINGDETIFNTTSGILNITFNSSLAGIFSLNISVNDTTGRQNSLLWNVTVYDYPVILSPSSSFIYSMMENITYALNFSVNHSVQDTLNYSLTINNVLRNTTTGYGNASDFLWDFTTNFTDETTCSGNVNLVLNVSNSKLSNTSTWNLQINHSNAPLIFLGTLALGNNNNFGGADSIDSATGSVTYDLTDYFSDVDATDSCVNQTIGFTTNLINGSSAITYVITNWTNQSSISAVYTNPGTTALAANYSFFGHEYNTTNGSHIFNIVSANNFTLEIDPPSTTPVATPSSGGGGGGGSRITKPISLKIIVPDPVSSKRKDRLVLPISLINSGEVILKNIFLRASVSKDGLFREDLIASFDKSIIDSLGIGAEEELTLIIDANTEEYGLYEITINATVENPKYNDWAKIFINVEETEDILERILFTEEFIVDNPECVELTELVDEARIFLNAGAIDESYKKLEEVIEACRAAIEQPALVRVRNQFEKYLFNYIWLVSIIVFIVGFIYYSYRRRKLRMGLKEINNLNSNLSKKEKFNNKKKFV